MSFSGKVKEEISEVMSSARHCSLHNFFERSTDPFQKWFTLL